MFVSPAQPAGIFFLMSRGVILLPYCAGFFNVNNYDLGSVVLSPCSKAERDETVISYH